jgi:hypothetical protein
MDGLAKAKGEIRKAEKALRAIASRLAECGDYTQMIEVAKLAEVLASLTRDTRPARVPDEQPPRRHQRTAVIAVKPKPAPADYPKFFRRGGELVKVGFSRTEGEYEHRAPQELIDEIAGKLQTMGAGGRIVSTSQLLGVVRTSTGEAPLTYQVYVVLAWLRSCGLIKAVGRQGYRAKAGVSLADEVRVLWKSLETEEL